MLPPPEGLWGMPPEMLQTLPGYDPDVQKNRARSPRDHGEARLRARQAARGQGVDAQHPALSRSGGDPDRPAEGDLHRRRARTDRHRATGIPRSCARTTPSGSTSASSGVDDPDQMFYENYACGASRNYTGYCNPEVDKLIDQQSMEADQEKRKQLVWEIERKLAEDGARPIIFYDRRGDLLAAAGQGADDDGQQHLQRLAHGRRLARQIATRAERSREANDGDTKLSEFWRLRGGAAASRLAAAAPAFAQKSGGVLRVHASSTARPSMSILEEVDARRRRGR